MLMPKKGNNGICMRKVDKTSFDAARCTQGGVSAADRMGESDLDSQHILEIFLNNLLRVIRGLVPHLLLADRRTSDIPRRNRKSAKFVLFGY